MRLLAVACLLAVSSCAGVHVRQLSPDGTRTVGPSGVRYYLPKPYLLVASSGSVAAGSGAGDDPTPVTPFPGSPPGRRMPPGAAPKPAAAGADAKDAVAPAASATTGFQVTTGGYTLKLVMLPDYSQPMAVTESPGLFGSASVSVTLADGWMLTSLNGSGDSKVSETLTALASLVPAIAGVGGGSAKPPGGPGTVGAPGPSLNPGLYEFRHDPQTGRALGFCAVTLFRGGLPVPATGTGCAPPAAPGSGG